MEAELAQLDAAGRHEVDQFNALKSELDAQRRAIQHVVMQPQHCLQFLRPGRLAFLELPAGKAPPGQQAKTVRGGVRIAGTRVRACGSGSAEHARSGGTDTRCAPSVGERARAQRPELSARGAAAHAAGTLPGS